MRPSHRQHTSMRFALRLAGVLLLLLGLGIAFGHVAGADHGAGEHCALCLLYTAKEAPPAAALGAIAFFWVFLFRPLYLAPVSRRYRLALGRSPPRFALR